MDTSSSSDNSNKEKAENFYHPEACMHCPYYSMAYNRPIDDEYVDVDTDHDDFDDDFDPGYRQGDPRRRRRRRKRRRRRRMHSMAFIPIAMIPYDDYDD